MTIDERLEALTQTVELRAAQRNDDEKKLAVMAEMIVANERQIAASPSSKTVANPAVSPVSAPAARNLQ